MELLIHTLVIGALVVAAWYCLRPPCNLRIVVRGGWVEVTGRALAGKRYLVSEFFRQDLPDLRQATIRGYWNGRQLSLSFWGRVPPAYRQRIRNYLLTTL